mgnify:FL=1
MGYAHADNSLRGVDKEMKKEDADQLIRCVRECWWRVLAVISFPIVASIAVFSDWPWDDSPWVAMGAVATFLAVLTAICIALSQRADEKLLREHRARIAAAYIAPILDKTAATMTLCFESKEPIVNITDGTKIILSGLWSIEKVTLSNLTDYSYLDPAGASTVSESIGLLVGFLEIKGLPRSYSDSYEYSMVLDGARKTVETGVLKQSRETFERVANRMKSLRVDI